MTAMNFQRREGGEEGKRTRVEVSVGGVRRGQSGEERGGAVGAGVKSQTTA